MTIQSLLELTVFFSILTLASFTSYYEQQQREQLMQQAWQSHNFQGPQAQIDRDCGLHSIEKRSPEKRLRAIDYKDRIIDTGIQIEPGRYFRPCPEIIQRPSKVSGSFGGDGGLELLKQNVSKILASLLASQSSSQAKPTERLSTVTSRKPTRTNFTTAEPTEELSTITLTTPIEDVTSASSKTTHTILTTGNTFPTLTVGNTNSDNLLKQPIQTNTIRPITTRLAFNRVNVPTQHTTKPTKLPSLIRSTSSKSTLPKKLFSSTTKATRYTTSMPITLTTGVHYEMTKSTPPLSSEKIRQTKSFPWTTKSKINTPYVDNNNRVVTVSTDHTSMKSVKSVTVWTIYKSTVKDYNMPSKLKSFTTKGISEASPVPFSQDKDLLKSSSLVLDNEQKLNESEKEGLTEILAVVISISVLVVFVGFVAGLLLYRKRKHRKIQNLPQDKERGCQK